MLKDCLEIFNEQLEQTKQLCGDGDHLILDTYVPADGDYLIVHKDGKVEKCTVTMDKKNRTVQTDWDEASDAYYQLKFYDYHSRLVSMDKPQDPKKVIHSNNYCAFWVKWESFENGKMDMQALDRYFDVLKNPAEKYKKPQERKMYDYILDQIGEVDQEKLEQHRDWLKEHVFCLDELGLNLKKKNYLKIFFEEDELLYIKEEQRYLVTKIFNKNDYNMELDDQILGLPNDNLGLNTKKPFLENKTRKVTIPYMITTQEALQQRKFFDYLMNQANLGCMNIFFDYEKKKILPKKKGEMVKREFSGFFIQIRKGKEEVEILHQDTIVDYRYNLRKKFCYHDVLGCDESGEWYHDYTNVQELQEVINQILFFKYLTGNYFTPEEELSVESAKKKNLIWSRASIFAWLYKGREANIDHILHKVCLDMIKNSLQNGYMKKVRQQFNLMCSLSEYFGGDQMRYNYYDIRNVLREKINEQQDCKIESDTEYFYAVGQLVDYFISLSKTQNKVHSLGNPFFNAASDEVIKRKLHQYFMKYNYLIKRAGHRFNRLYAMVLDYVPERKVSPEDIVAGYINDNLIYEKKEKEEV